MPRDLMTHEHRRRRICAVCLGKGGQKITPTVLNRIRAFPERKFFNPEDKRLPAGICGTCRVTLSKKSSGDRSLKNVPKLVRVKRVEVKSASCPCRWCKKTRTSAIGKMKPKVKRGPKVQSTPRTEEAKIPAAACLKIQDSLSLSTNQTLKMATTMRKEMGRAAVEPFVREAIEERDRQLKGLFSSVSLTKDDTTAPAVVCNDISDLLQRVIRHRQVDPHNHWVKLGMDGGGGMLKVTCNIITDNNNNDEIAGASTPAPFRETGVKRLLLLAVAPEVPETYQLMSELLRHIRLEEIGGLIVAADLSVARSSDTHTSRKNG